MKKLNVIVFGGSGFIGSHVADLLSNNNYNVTIYDLEKSKYLKKNQKMIVGDINDFQKINYLGSPLAKCSPKNSFPQKQFPKYFPNRFFQTGFFCQNRPK